METDGGDKTSLCKPQPTFQFLWQYFSPRCVCVCLFVAYLGSWESCSICSCAIGNGDLPRILSLRNHNLKSIYRALSETEIKPTHLAFTELNYRYETQPLPFPCNNPAPKHSNARARNARVRHSSQLGFARERDWSDFRQPRADSSAPGPEYQRSLQPWRDCVASDRTRH